jgi:predicted CXXCH cytochrome family protein
MKTTPSFPLRILLIVLFAASPAIAEKVEHHGNMVENEGTADSCIACHDGSSAGNAAFCTVKCDFSTPHSIMRKYPPRGKRALYAPSSEVKAKGIRLVNGMVTCISCHELKSRVAYHLILDDQGRLCAVCHLRERSRSGKLH